MLHFIILIALLYIVYLICNDRHFHTLPFVLGFIFFFVMVIAFRPNSIPDTAVYIKNYSQLYNKALPQNNFEPGYVGLCLAFSRLTLDYHYLFGFISLLSLSSILFLMSKLDNSSNKYIVLLGYIPYWGLYFNTITIRVAVAVSIILIGIGLYIKSRKKVIFFIMMIIPIYFHYSIIFFLPGLLFFDVSLTKNRRLFFMLICFFIYIFNIGSIIQEGIIHVLMASSQKILILQKYCYYLNSNSPNNGVAFKYIIALIWAVVAIENNIQNDSRYRPLLNIYMVGIFLFSIGRSFLLIERITDLYLVYGSFFLPFIVKKSKSGLVGYMLPFVYSAIYLIFYIRIAF